MKHVLWTLLFVLVTLSLMAVPQEQVSTMGDRIQVTIDAKNANLGSDAIVRTYALPAQNAVVRVNQITVAEYDANGVKLRTVNSSEGQDHIRLVNQFTMREMRGFTVKIIPETVKGGISSKVEKISFTIEGSGSINMPTSVSGAFLPVYEKYAANFGDSYLRNLPLQKPKMLIISHSSITDYLSSFVKWKRARGYDVDVVNKTDIGTSTVAIKAYLTNYYTLHHPEYVLLLGDDSGSYGIPTNIYDSPDGQEHDADDNYYTMVEGNDYFPEMLIGRFSFVDVGELTAMLSKTMRYERMPPMDDTAWFKKALVVAGNYAEGGLQPVTPIQMSRWLREKMIAKGYTQVDTVFYPPTYPGTSQIQSAISSGAQFVSYRGWGDANGWHYPLFHLDHLSNAASGTKTPVVFSIVCNTGDFINSVNPSFGEKWMRMGTSFAPNGCVAFVGPSDLHTRTNLNNALSTGAFSSILDDGNRIFASSVLAGKMELYHSFPDEAGTGGYVPFYFHVYNVLSDPSLNMWVLVPNQIAANIPTQIDQAVSSLTINLPGLNGAIVTGTKDELHYDAVVVHNGKAILPVNPNQSGNLKVVITKDNYIPCEKTIEVTAGQFVGMSQVLNNSIFNPGQAVELQISVKNFSSTTSQNISAVLSGPEEYVTIATASQSYGVLQSGAEQSHTYIVNVKPNCPANTVLEFNLDLSEGGQDAAFSYVTAGAEYELTTAIPTLTIGGTTNISFSVKNIGTIGLNNASIKLHSLTTAAQVVNETQALPAIVAGNSATMQWAINVNSDCYVGRNIPLAATITTAEGYETISRIDITAGAVTNTAPTGPDTYGYFAYDSNDTGYAAKPTYQWVEIDPTLGGAGQVVLMQDDKSFTTNLPFTFKYYGQNFSQITMCSNGWISLIPTWMTNFMNSHIPGAIGPYAMIAPYWDDLKGLKVSENTFNDMRICYYHDTANNRYIVEWNDAYNNYNIDLGQDASLEKFQVILIPRAGTDGDIVFQYHTVDNPDIANNYSTVGIENPTQSDGLTYCFANRYAPSASTLQNNLAIRFTTAAPDNFVASEDPIQTPLVTSLEQNYPNPFNPMTTIRFTLTKGENAKLSIFNTKGQLIKTLASNIRAAGTQSAIWDGKDEAGKSVASGIYFYRLETAQQTLTKKMLLVK